MDIPGWTYRDILAPQQFVRTFGKRTAIVTRLDGCTWGYTLWTSGGCCLGGEAKWEWMPEDACAAAENFTLSIPE